MSLSEYDTVGVAKDIAKAPAKAPKAKADNDHQNKPTMSGRKTSGPVTIAPDTTLTTWVDEPVSAQPGPTLGATQGQPLRRK